jgi:hypothetical protein
MSEISHGDAVIPLQKEAISSNPDYTPLTAEQIKELLGGFELSAAPEMQGSDVNKAPIISQNLGNPSDLSEMMNLMGEIHSVENGTKNNETQSINNIPQAEAKGLKKLMLQISNFFKGIFRR